MIAKAVFSGSGMSMFARINTPLRVLSLFVLPWALLLVLSIIEVMDLLLVPSWVPYWLMPMQLIAFPIATLMIWVPTFLVCLFTNKVLERRFYLFLFGVTYTFWSAIGVGFSLLAADHPEMPKIVPIGLIFSIVFSFYPVFFKYAPKD